MSYFNMTILGCGSATPTLRHFPSAQAVRYRNRVMLVDCGEGCQLQMRRFGLPFTKVTDIFISHLHGDHFLGRPGLLSTMALHDMQGGVTVHTFARGAEVLSRLMAVVCPERPYELKFNIIEPSNPGILFEDTNLVVSAFRLYHRVPCVGFRFDEKPKRRHIDADSARFFGVPHYMMDSLRDGADFTDAEGRVIANERLTKAPSPSLSYAYCSDTAFDLRVAEAVKGVDVLYHEATYGDERAVYAAPRGHSTAREAARIAAAAAASTLVLGHYSKTVTDESILVSEACQEFDGTVIAGREGLQIDLI